MIDYEKIINKHIVNGCKLYDIYYRHVEEVARKSYLIGERLGLDSDRLEFIYESAMLHDIGIVTVNCPSIHCFGRDPYLYHWINGYNILLEEGVPEHAEVAKRHATPPLEQFVLQKYQIPGDVSDYEPLTIEQRIISYSDLFSTKCTKKNNDHCSKSLEEVIMITKKYSPNSPEVIRSWARDFGDL